MAFSADLISTTKEYIRCFPTSTQQLLQHVSYSNEQGILIPSKDEEKQISCIPSSRHPFNRQYIMLCLSVS